MKADDARHGTNGGYLQHVFAKESACTPCRDAHSAARRQLWRKRYVRGVDRLYIDATGTIRRIRALMALGWRYRDIDAAAGHDATRATWAHNLTTQQRVHVDTADRIARIYDEMSMTIGPSLRLRKIAMSRGWAPPLAWDNIDDPNETPIGWEYRPRVTRNQNADDVLDPVVVMRLLEGDRVPSTAAERTAALERWVADGGSEAELCRWHGWNAGRYSAGLRLVRGGAA